MAHATAQGHAAGRVWLGPIAERWLLNARRFELTALAALLLAALLMRVTGAEDVEPNILPDEADHLGTMYRILAGHGPGPFDLSWDGNPAFQLYPSLLFVALFGRGYLALRLSVALASVLMLAAFYLVCRARCSPLAAWSATGLLAMSPWTLFFSRNGEVNVFVALYALLAAWSLQRALVSKGWWPWVSAGLWAGMGWYGFLAGVLILPMLLAPLPLWLWRRRAESRRLLQGSALMIAVCGLVVLPRLPAMYEHWGAVQRYVEGRSVLRGVSPAQMPALLANQVTRTVRAFLILDPSLEGNARYLAPNRAPLDGFAGSLYVAGLALSIWSLSQSALWLAMLLVPIGLTQVLTTGIPDLARAITALPAHYLFAGLAIDRLLRATAFRPVLRAAAAVAVPAIGWANWQVYSDWMTTQAAAEARQPALDYVEFDAWRGEQERRANSDGPVLTVDDWRAEHPRVASLPRLGRQSTPPGGSGVFGRPGNGQQRAAGPLDLSSLFSLDVGRGQRAPRGVAAAPGGSVFVVEQGGRVLRLDEDQRALAPLGASSPSGQVHAWDLAADESGFLYLLDAERGAVVRVSPGGEVERSFGAEWGTYHPRGIDLGPDGRIYVADTGRNRIVIASTDGKQLGALGPRTSAGELEQPTDVAVDGDGQIYVALPELGRIEVFDATGKELDRWPIAKSDTIDSPRLALTSGGAVVVSEPSERRVRVFGPGGRQLGQIETGFAMPFGLAVVDGRLYVTDPGAGRLFAFELTP